MSKPKKEEFPVITSFSLQKVADGWIAVKIQTKGTEVIKVEKLNEPDMKPIAVERFKIEVAKDLLS